ncbi:sugar ABC transporter ATP-binding protein [Kribbella shirazensis]|uniref:Ribose transport system ATP-binding protein n=1 Tax=Kribbella shirazensis TaxID=1105143 RepID=A0A7X6A1L8_9ACTN|nr:sugar ABC transporter ATP-binding protein [Kribbella shirazensis]NIK57334.1 ribose transport system ATP-binding protein [Kribbella shirazensis]
MTPVVQLRDIRKSFDGVPVLLGVDFEVGQGEVHALAGGNGAGKSTLMKILQGVYTKDAGEILVAGTPVTLTSVDDAKAAGIGMVFQEFSLVPSLTVAQNLFLSAETTSRFGLISDRDSRDRARRIFADLEVDVDVDAMVGDLSTAYWQLTEIAKALAQNAQVLILDEPTASLAKNEVEALFALIGRLKSRGISIIYISHRMDEIYRIADRITILRDGRRLLTRPLGEVTPAEIVEGIVGRPDDGALSYQERASSEGGEVLLEAVEVYSGDRVRGVSFQLRAGEILGLAGLMGSGRSELARCLFGIDRIDAGEVRMRGRRIDLRNPRDAQRAGIALIPEDRREQGLVLEHSVEDNLLLPVLRTIRRGPFLDTRSGRRLTRTLIDKVAIKGDPRQPVRRLSGGNQQKVVIAKWLGTQPEVLIMDEPTAGVDIGTKSEIVAIIRRLADAGGAVIVISSEYPELLAVSDRVLVLRNGSVADELRRADIPDEESLQLSVQGL